MFRTYATAITDNPDVAINYLAPRVSEDGQRALVRTEIPQAGTPAITINYRLHQGNGSWEVYDFVVEGVSLVQTFRSNFTLQARQVGIDGLIDQMAAKNQERQGS